MVIPVTNCLRRAENLKFKFQMETVKMRGECTEICDFKVWLIFIAKYFVRTVWIKNSPYRFRAAMTSYGLYRRNNLDDATIFMSTQSAICQHSFRLCQPIMPIDPEPNLRFVISMLNILKRGYDYFSYYEINRPNDRWFKDNPVGLQLLIKSQNPKPFR